MVSHKLCDVQRPAITNRRESAHYPGLSLELTAPYLTFRHGRTCEVFLLAGGEAELIASSRESYQDLERFEHVRKVAQLYAADLVKRPARVRRPGRNRR